MTKLFATFGVSLLLVSGLTAGVFAGEADVTNVTIKKQGDEFVVNATVVHADDGWDHYADRWDVLDENGNVLGERVLAHPHENNVPFTRSTRVKIPASVKVITVRAHDNVHGLGGKEFKVEVPH